MTSFEPLIMILSPHDNLEC